jgi:hypothetical protein
MNNKELAIVSIDNYPFDRSFNELNIIEWVDSITEATN